MKGALMRVSYLFALLLILTFPAASLGAKPKSDRPTSGVVSVDVEELRAGPGAAYVSRGRTYQGESVSILETSDTGEWFRVKVNQLTGWLPIKSVRLQAGPSVPVADAGRNRRQSNYTYDASGRRRALDGKTAGSGEGFGAAPPEDDERMEVSEPQAQDPRFSESKNTLSVQFGLGLGLLERTFRTSVDPRSFLAAIDVSSPGLNTHLAAEWRPLPALSIAAFGRDTRLGTVEVVRPSDIDRGTVELSTQAQHAGLNVLGRVSWGDFWVGGGVGGHYLRHAFRETKPVAILLTTSAYGVSGVLDVGARLGRFDARATFSYIHPLSIEQSPTNSGTPDGTIWSASAQAGYRLTPFLALYGEAALTGFDVDYTGRAPHRDTVTASRDIVYDGATEENLFTDLTVGLRWSN